MKKQVIYPVVIILGLVAVSCTCKKALVKTQDQKVTEIRKNTEDDMAAKQLPFTIDTAWVSNLVLFVDISYTGDKTNAEFSLVWNGSWLKSYPPKAMVYISTGAPQGIGKKTVKHHLSFDFSAIKGGNEEFYLMLRDYPTSFHIGG